MWKRNKKNADNLPEDESGTALALPEAVRPEETEDKHAKKARLAAEKKAKREEDAAAKKAQKEEAAAALAAVPYVEEDDLGDEKDEVVGIGKKVKGSIARKVVGAQLYDGAVDMINTVTPIIKSVFNNKAIIKRRLDMVVTAIAFIFFLLYVPVLLFNKIANGLSLGWEVALYTCIAVYAAAMIIFVIVHITTVNVVSSVAHKRAKLAYKIINFVLRLASLAIAITAICISNNSEDINAMDILTMVLAIVSIVFTSLSLVFSGFINFFKWLISPARLRQKFSVVAFEWKQNIDDEKTEQTRAVKRSIRRYRDKVDACLDKYILPPFGKTYIDKVDEDAILHMVSDVPVEDINLTEWIIKDVFAYAMQCGYVKVNPCDKLDLVGDITAEQPNKPDSEQGSSTGGVIGRIASLFKK